LRKSVWDCRLGKRCRNLREWPQEIVEFGYARVVGFDEASDAAKL
jgi:hypothetical protein